MGIRGYGIFANVRRESSLEEFIFYENQLVYTGVKTKRVHNEDLFLFSYYLEPICAQT
jgi:hypothetical protein